MRGDTIPLKATTIGPSGKRWRADDGPTVMMECWFGSFVIFMGSGPVLLRQPIFC